MSVTGCLGEVGWRPQRSGESLVQKSFVSIETIWGGSGIWSKCLLDASLWGNSSRHIKLEGEQNQNMQEGLLTCKHPGIPYGWSWKTWLRRKMSWLPCLDFCHHNQDLDEQQKIKGWMGGKGAACLRGEKIGPKIEPCGMPQKRKIWNEKPREMNNTLWSIVSNAKIRLEKTHFLSQTTGVPVSHQAGNKQKVLIYTHLVK